MCGMNNAPRLTVCAFLFADILMASNIMYQRPLREERTPFASIATKHNNKTRTRGMMTTKVPPQSMDVAVILMDDKLYALSQKAHADELVKPCLAGCTTFLFGLCLQT